MISKKGKPDWYDESKLKRVYYANDYTGWVIDMEDGTCRFVNQPLLGKNGPKWGDRVKLIKNSKDDMDKIDYSEILERYKDEISS